MKMRTCYFEVPNIFSKFIQFNRQYLFEQEMQEGNHPNIQTYLALMLKSFEEFEETRSPFVLEKFTKENRKILRNMVEQIQENRSGGTNDKMIRKNSFDGFESVQNSQYDKEKEEYLKLEKQYEYQLEIAKGKNLEESQYRQQSRYRQMDSTLVSLTQQIAKLKGQNEMMAKKLQKKRFYKEWVLMSKEAEGAKNLNRKLKKELEQKKQEIEEWKVNH